MTVNGTTTMKTITRAYKFRLYPTYDTAAADPASLRGRHLSMKHVRTTIESRIQQARAGRLVLHLGMLLAAAAACAHGLSRLGLVGIFLVLLVVVLVIVFVAHIFEENP